MYTSARLCALNSIPALAFKNSLICEFVRHSAFRILMCIPQRLAYPVPPIFRIILHWNQVLFQDHLVLDNSLRIPTAILAYTEWLPDRRAKDEGRLHLHSRFPTSYLS